MLLILYNQQELDASDADLANRLSAFNFCNPFDHVLPFSDGSIERADRAHLWGLYPGVFDDVSPVLSLPTAAKTGATTATGTVTTDEGNGTLYYWATQNAIETAADIISNGASQAVSAVGIQNVSISGLAEATDYYAHYVQNDSLSNESNVVRSDVFTTDSAPVVDSGQTSGGFWFDYDGEMARRKKRLKELEEEEDKTRDIRDELDREIALVFRREEEEENRLIELTMLTKIAHEHQEDMAQSFNDKVMLAANRAIMKGNYSAMEAFERQVMRLREEEEFLIAATILLVNQ